MKRPITMLLTAAVALGLPALGAASDRVVGAELHDHTAANEALDRAESNAPDEANDGLSTAREAVNEQGVGEGSRATGARNSSSGSGSAGRSSNRGGSRGGGSGR